MLTLGYSLPIEGVASANSNLSNAPVDLRGTGYEVSLFGTEPMVGGCRSTIVKPSDKGTVMLVLKFPKIS